MRPVLAACLPVLAAALLAAALWPRAGTAQSAEALFARAMDAFAQGDYEASAGLFDQVTRQDPRRAEAYYMLARLYLEPPLQDLERSKEAVKRALKLEPDNPRYLAIRLLHRRLDPSGFLPPLQRERQRRLARKILQRDSTNALAHQELGIQQTDVFLLYDGAVVLKARQGGCANRFDVACLRAQGAAVLDLSEEAEAAYPEALRHLRRAVASDPGLLSAYDHLMRLYAARTAYDEALALSDTMQVHLPGAANAWLYSGWARYQTGAFAAAAQDFERALGLLPPVTRTVFEDLHFLLPEKEEKAYRQDPAAYAARFWAGRDPRLLTAYNERRLEHYARLVTVDLLYGASNLGKRGWETDRGRIFLRYGAPQQRYLIRGTRFYASDNRGPFEASRRTGTFIIWEYDSFRFVFEDPDSFMNNAYRLYSPSAAEYARSTRTVVEDNDYVIQAREMARKMPERSQYRPPGGRAAMPYLVSVFRGDAGRADVYVSYGLPVAVGPHFRTGVFLLDGRYAVVAEAREDVDVPASAPAGNFGGTAFRTGAARMQAPPGAYEVAVEFETRDEQVAGYHRSPAAVPAFEEGVLMLSDLMPAYLVEETDTAGAGTAPGVVERNGFAVTTAPGGVFSTGEPVYLYFEMYNLARDARGATAYEIEAVLVPWREDPKGVQKLLQKAFGREEQAGVAVRFDGAGASPDEARYLIMDVREQPAGRYVLGLRVRDRVRGETVEKSREVVLE